MNNTLINELIQKLDGAYAESTIRAYRKNLESYATFCELKGYPFLPSPAEAIVAFIDHLTGLELSAFYIRRHVTAIALIHRMSRYPDPTIDPDIKIALRRAFRQRGRYQRQAVGMNYVLIDKILQGTPETLHGTRNRMLLQVASETLCRRSELVQLRIEDIETLDHPQYCVRILLRKSKTDPFKEGRWLFITQKGKTMIDQWLEKTGLTRGYLLRGIRKGDHLTEQLHPGQVNKALKRMGRAMGLPKATVEHISGHSIRVGAAQDLCAQGSSLAQIMAKGRWVKTDTLMRYVEHAII